MDSFMFRVSIAAGEFPMEEPQGQNRFFDRCAQYLLELSDELERNLYIEAIVKEYRRYGISVENLRKRVNSLAMKELPQRSGSSPNQETRQSGRRKVQGKIPEADAYLACHLSGNFETVENI